MTQRTNNETAQQWINHVNCWLMKAFCWNIYEEQCVHFQVLFVTINRQLQSSFQWSEMVSAFQYHSTDKRFTLKLDQFLLKLKCCFTSTETVGILGMGANDVRLHFQFHTAPELWVPLLTAVVWVQTLFHLFFLIRPSWITSNNTNTQHSAHTHTHTNLFTSSQDIIITTHTHTHSPVAPRMSM